MDNLLLLTLLILALLSFGIISFINPLYIVLLLLVVRPSLDLYQGISLYKIGNIDVNVNIIFLFISILISLIYILRKNNLSFFRLKINYLIFSFIVIISFCSFYINKESFISIASILRWLGIYAFFILGFYVGNDSNFIYRLSQSNRIILLSSVIPIVFSIIQIINGEFSFYTEMHGFQRLQGTFVHPGAYGCFLAMVLSFSLPKLLISEKIELPWIIINVLLFFFLVLSFFKTAWFGTAFALFITIVSTRKGRVPIPLILIIFVGFFFFDSLISQRLADTQSLYWRFGIWNYLLSHINSLSDLLIGQGLGATKYFISYLVGTNVTTAHSTYVELIVDYGAIPTILFVLIHILSFKNAFFLINQNNILLKQFGSSMILITSLFLFIYLSQTLIKPLFMIYLFFIIGFSGGIITNLKKVAY